MTKCFLLGAGASFGYRRSENEECIPPGSTEFFSKGRELEIFTEDKFPSLYDSYEQYINEAEEGDLSDDGEPDIEDVMINLLSEGGLPTAVRQLSFYIYELLRIYTLNYNPEDYLDNYQKLAQLYYDSPYYIISLNYDMLFEQAAMAHGLSPYYIGIHKGNLRRRQFQIGKIHGSINWLQEIPHRFPQQFQGIDPPEIGEEDEYWKCNEEYEYYVNQLQGMNIGMGNRVDGEEIRTIPVKPPGIANSSCRFLIFGIDEYYYKPAIVPPLGGDKPYEIVGELEHVQNETKSMVSASSELVIIGSRIRKMDDKLHEILGELDSEAKITLVVGESSEDCVVENIKKYIGDEYEIEKRSQRFGDYIDDLI